MLTLRHSVVHHVPDYKSPLDDLSVLLSPSLPELSGVKAKLVYLKGVEEDECPDESEVAANLAQLEAEKQAAAAAAQAAEEAPKSTVAQMRARENKQFQRVEKPPASLNRYAVRAETACFSTRWLYLVRSRWVN